MIHLVLSSHLRMGLPIALFLSGFLTKAQCAPHPSPMRATYTAYLILLILITREVLGGPYMSLSSSLCSFLYFSVTSSLFGPNT